MYKQPFGHSSRRFLAVGILLGGMASSAWAVDGVVLINQASALAGNVTPGDTPGFPVTISQPGSYRLTGNLTVSDKTANAIEITVNQVTLDLNGFSILGPGPGTGSTGKGITTHAPGGGGINVTVTNGTVYGMGSDGIRLDSSCTVDHVKTLNNGGDGINLTSGAHVLNSESAGNQGNGIVVFSGIIAANIVAVNQGAGVYLSKVNPYYGGPPDAGTTVIDNEIDRSTGFGLLVDPTSFAGYARNGFFNNYGGNVSGGVQIGPNMCGSSLCP